MFAYTFDRGVGNSEASLTLPLCALSGQVVSHLPMPDMTCLKQSSSNTNVHTNTPVRLPRIDVTSS